MYITSPPSQRHSERPISIVELRRYRLKVGERENLIALFDREFLESQEAAGMEVFGQFRDLDDPNSFVWIRGFHDMESRKQALSNFYSGPVWAKHRNAANNTMVNSDNVLLLRPSAPFGLFSSADRVRPSLDARGDRAGLIVATIAYLAPRTECVFGDFFQRDVLPVLLRSGARIVGAFMTQRSENTFPNLPIREGETVFVWFSTFKDNGAYNVYNSKVAASIDWRERILPELESRVWRPNEVTRLSPTARSVIYHDSGV